MYQAETCERKRREGNCYLSRREAKARAKVIRRRAGAFVWAYRCPACSCWHLGKPTPLDLKRHEQSLTPRRPIE